MRRYCSYVLSALFVVALTGCSFVPSFPKITFPDLWPFNDEPVVAGNGNAPQNAASNNDEPPIDSEPLTESAEAKSRPLTEQQASLAPSATRAPVVAGPAINGGGATASTPGAVVYIISPADGAIVTNPVKVLFGLDRMGVAPVSSSDSGTGHHHLLVDTPLPEQLDLPIPVDQNHLHFSGGQTETSLNLPVGQHTLQLLLGDHTHTPHQPPVASRQIIITVQ